MRAELYYVPGHVEDGLVWLGGWKAHVTGAEFPQQDEFFDVEHELGAGVNYDRDTLMKCAKAILGISYPGEMAIVFEDDVLRAEFKHLYARKPVV